MEDNWTAKRDLGRRRPALMIGGQKSAHYTAINQGIRLVHEAGAFDQLISTHICLSPNQFVVLGYAGALLKSIEDMYTWEGKSVLTDGWGEISRRFHTEYLATSAGSEVDDELTNWRKCVSSSSGPTLDSPTFAAVLASRLIVAYHTSTGFWCQAFRDGLPEAKAFHLPHGQSKVGFLLVVELDPHGLQVCHLQKNTRKA